MGEARLFGRASLLRLHFRRACPIMVPSAGRGAGRVTVVYLDSVFVLNGLMDYLLALCAARLAGVPLRRGRYVLAGVLGGAYAAAVFLPGLSFLCSLLLVFNAAAFGGLARGGASLTVTEDGQVVEHRETEDGVTTVYDGEGNLLWTDTFS